MLRLATRLGRVSRFHFATAIGAVAAAELVGQVSIYWIGGTGYPLGAPGEHGGFHWNSRVLLVALIGAAVGAVFVVLRNEWSRVGGKVIALSAIGFLVAFFLAVDWGLLWGFVLRPLSIRFERTDNWWMLGPIAARAWAWIAFWVAIEFPWWVTTRVVGQGNHDAKTKGFRGLKRILDETKPPGSRP